MIRTSLSITGLVENMSHTPTSAMAQTPTWTKWHACSQQRSTLSTSPLNLEMWVILGLVEYLDLPNVSSLITVEREWGKFPLMPGI